MFTILIQIIWFIWQQCIWAIISSMCKKHHWPVCPVIILYPVITLCQVQALHFATATKPQAADENKNRLYCVGVFIFSWVLEFMLIVKYSTCRIFYAWFTISAQLLSDSFPYNAYMAHIQNNALLYFCNIIHVHHCLCLQGRHRIFMQINILLNKFTFTTFFVSF